MLKIGKISFLVDGGVIVWWTIPPSPHLSLLPQGTILAQIIPSSRNMDGDSFIIQKKTCTKIMIYLDEILSLLNMK